MKHFALIALGLSLALFAACTTPAGSGGSVVSTAPAKNLPEDQVVAWVNELPISKELLDQMLAQMPPYMKSQFQTAEGMHNFVDNLVGVELIYQKASAEGFEKRAEVQEKLRQMAKQVVYSEYLEEAMKNLPGPDEAAVRKFYDENPQAKSMEFDQVKDRISEMLKRQTQQQEFERIVTDLKGKAQVRYNDKVIAAAAGPAPAAPGGPTDAMMPGAEGAPAGGAAPDAGAAPPAEAPKTE